MEHCTVVNPVLAQLGGYPLAAFQDLARQLRAEGEPVHDFSVGDPVEPTPEFIRRALVDAVPVVSQYPTAAGLPELRHEIAAWTRRRHGVEVDPRTQVLPTAGSKEGVFHAPLALIDPPAGRTHAIWGAPGYQPYERGVLLAGGASDPVALDAAQGWRLELDRLGPGRLDRAFVAWINYPHNPTGATIDLDYLRRALATCRDRGVVLGSDECYTEIYPPHADPPPSLLEACDGDLTDVLVFVSLSKRSGMTGYRCGAIIGDAELVAAQRLLRPNVGTASPEFVQHAAVAAWSDDEHVAARREIFQAKREVMLALLDELGLEVSGSQATFYLWVRAPGGDDRAYAEALLARRVIVSPGSTFGPAGAGWLRLALVPSVDGCRAAAAAWRAAAADGTLPGQ